MNNYTKYIPFTLFNRFIVGKLLDMPIMRLRQLHVQGQGHISTAVYRSLRDTVRNLSTGTHRKEDIGINRSISPNQVSGGYMGLMKYVTESSIPTACEWYLTTQGGMRKPTLWSEMHRVAQKMPRNIIYTNRGWVQTKYFMDNPHLEAYIPIGRRRHEVSWSNFRPLDRSTMRFEASHGWLDGTIELTRRGLQDMSATFVEDGETYPISDALYHIKPHAMTELRIYARGLVRSVQQGAITTREASHKLRNALIEHEAVRITSSHAEIQIEHEKAWRGFYLTTYQEVSSEVARILRSMTQGLVISGADYESDEQETSTLYSGTCNACGERIYPWNPHETVELDVEQLQRRNYSRYRAIKDVNYYCSADHALQDSRIFTAVARPERKGYHTNVLHTASIGASNRIAPDRQLRRVGIELETFMPTVTSGRIPNFVIGGTLKDKKFKSGVRPIVWSDAKYAKWGAIPTRDGSLSDSFGVEWVFRPSDLDGLNQDVTKFLAATKGHIVRDGTAEHEKVHSSQSTYGLHVHVTATDTMDAVITRLRLTLVGDCLSGIIHAIGKRGYSNYTRQYDGDLLRMDVIKSKRLALSRVEGWRKHVSPFALDEGHIMRGGDTNGSHAITRRASWGEGAARQHAINAVSDSLFSRYNMINITYGKPTIEMRHGKGIVDEGAIMTNAELAQAVVLFGTYEVMSVQQCSYENLPKQFAKWVLANNEDYPRLARWMWSYYDYMSAYVVTPSKRVHTRYTGE